MAIAAVLVLAVVIWILVALSSFVGEHGVKGLLDVARSAGDTLWQGSGQRGAAVAQ